MTLRENILLPARNVPDIDLESELAELIAFFDMADFIDRHPNEASVGQRQRIARALILKPRYLLLDEITSALDIEQTARILAKLSLLRNLGIGIFLITHALGFARRAADRVIFMANGAIVEDGPPDILSQPKTSRLKDFMALAETAR